MRIAAVVTLFHPGKETITNIKSYDSFAEKIYVFDNTEQCSILAQDFNSHPKIAYFHNGQNEGIASRLNMAAEFAIKDGFDWLLLMDQDSSFKPTMIADYEKCFKAFEYKENIGMFGVNFMQDLQLGNLPCEFVFSEDLITSGTLLNLALFPSIGNFDENLFIDGVDHDYSIKTLLGGYKIIQFKNIELTHSIGLLVKRASIKTFFLVKKEKILHSPLRCYYIYRNNLYMQKKYKNIKIFDMGKLETQVSSAIKRALYYGRSFWKLMYYLAAAKRDFKKNKMGKYQGK